jgi:Ca2+-binding RTX toxin-like protein
MIGGPGDDNVPCEFSAFVDPEAALTGGPGNDRIYGGPGDDLLRDTSPDDKDKLFGGLGNDTLEATDDVGANLVDGGPGKDDCSGDAADTFVYCERITRL